ncbi:protein kinase [Streptomyces actuosus]|uniref:Protein kinase n=1 Tax=Streptomyces actuosus TaxID=1885 RepID=A0ABS2VY40_STRAS|nr:penicillin-binding transpeptidase domain-containing protein [Streptomyces actuosus]MBN0048046.1 protein kinase [Streptomyces actuosus]
MVQALGPGDPAEIAGYRVRARLGAGGMGVVYLCYTPGGQPVALKVIRQEFAQDAEFRRRFTREVQAARRVQGAYTVPVLDSQTAGPHPWLATAYTPGPALSTAVSTYGPLPPLTVLQLTAGVAEALQSVHAAGLIHRDLKPSNVLLAFDGPRVIDFGIARAMDATALTGTDERLGTPAYMAPEQVSGREATSALDVFALGLVTFFAATGKHAFGEGPSHALLYRIVAETPDLRDCPEQLRELTARCLAKEPAERPTPSQVIEVCREQAGEGRLERDSRGWLPFPVTAWNTAAMEPPDASGPAGPADPAAGPVPPSPRNPPGSQGSPAPRWPVAAPQPGGPERQVRRARQRVTWAVLAALVVGLSTFAALRLTQGGGTGDQGTSGASAGPLGDIVVGGKPVTGTERTGASAGPYQRTYSDGALYHPVTGHRSQSFGTSGLEAIYKEVLDGTDGRLHGTPGRVVTTVVPEAQKAAYRALNGRQGAAVAIEPSSGRILALVSTPSSDPSSFSGNTSSDAAAWRQATGSASQPLLNRALRATYPPGSTFKVVTAAAALEFGLYDTADGATNSPVPYLLPNTTTELKDETGASCRNASLRVALQRSCNTVFGKIGADLGTDTMLAEARKFGFGAEQRTPLLARTSVFPDTANTAQTVLSSIGAYDTAATPLQMAMVAAAVANDGLLMKPYLVDVVQSSDRHTLEQARPKALSRPLSERNAHILQSMMETVVTSGAGRDARIDGVTVGGKTGTAQYAVGNSEKPYAWFISYAKPGDGSSPVAVAVVVEDDAAHVDDVGGGAAAKVARLTMEAVLEQ